MNIIIDFDSTIIQGEGLDILSEICFNGNTSKVKEIEELTNSGMNGSISMQESLLKRIKLLKATKQDIDLLSKKLIELISPSIHSLRAYSFLFPQNTYVVSGGFIDYVLPVCRILGIYDSQIVANKFIYDGVNIIGFDSEISVSKSNGKSKAVKDFNLAGSVFIVGDGYTDYEVKLDGCADYFIAFTETVKRDKVIDKADFVASNFNEVVKFIDDKRI